MRAKRLVAAAVLGGIVGAAGCKSCETCGKKSDGVPAGYGGAVGSSLPASQGQPVYQGQPTYSAGGAGLPTQMPPPSGTGRMPTGGAGAGAYGGATPTGGMMQ